MTLLLVAQRMGVHAVTSAQSNDRHIVVRHFCPKSSGSKCWAFSTAPTSLAVRIFPKTVTPTRSFQIQPEEKQAPNTHVSIHSLRCPTRYECKAWRNRCRPVGGMHCRRTCAAPAALRPGLQRPELRTEHYMGALPKPCSHVLCSTAWKRFTSASTLLSCSPMPIN